MSVFGAYARYYDLLYRDKDYEGEVRFIQKLLHRHAPDARSLLELGSGTGMHAALLAATGYMVTGVELSDEMLATAKQRQQALAQELTDRLHFVPGDIRDSHLDANFDAAISLFHVISYLPTNDDVLAALTTARKHLKTGGIFLFDFWYGPTVLTDRPVVRVKRVEDEAIRVVRIAEPTLSPNANLVDVQYHAFVKDKVSQVIEEIQENHRMRYLFLPEIDMLFAQVGFARIDCGEWMTEREPGFDTWGVYVVARAQ
jgi:SAM-dependent methyltransferase